MGSTIKIFPALLFGLLVLFYGVRTAKSEGVEPLANKTQNNDENTRGILLKTFGGVEAMANETQEHDIHRRFIFDPFGSAEKIVDRFTAYGEDIYHGTREIIEEIPVEGEWSWCDTNLGCLYFTDDWYDRLERPLNFVPQSRYSIGTHFFIHTRERENYWYDDEVISYQDYTLQGTYFDPTRPTKFIIHGFMGYADHKWIYGMAQDLLDYGDYNVFRVHWGDGARTSYGQAVGNTRVVGREISILVEWLVNFYDVDPVDVHLIGHSLGCHIAGYAGKEIPSLGRISGLDPAGLYFSYMPHFVRLDESDAIFVDNYHTDGNINSNLAFGYGTMQPMGNLDFYANGGQTQPGCEPSKISIDALTSGDSSGYGLKLVTCSHGRAFELYRETLTQTYAYRAQECKYFDRFEAGDCDYCGDDNFRCAPIGIRASEYGFKYRVNVKMWFNTNENSPYL